MRINDSLTARCRAWRKGRNQGRSRPVEPGVLPFLDGLLKLATYPADTLPGRLGRRLRRVRLALRRNLATAVVTTLR